MSVEKYLSESEKIKDLYNKYNEKAILEAIDTTKTYKLLNLIILYRFILFSFVLLFAFEYNYSVPFYSNSLLLHVLLYIFIIVLSYYFSLTKIYFNSDKIIIQNILKKEFELDKYPRIYTTSEYIRNPPHSYIAYYIHFYQNNKIAKIRILRNNVKKLESLLTNLKIIELSNLSKERQLLSANDKEKFLENYISTIQGKRIITVKNRQLKTVLFSKKFVKISYPNDNIIKVNWKRFNYNEHAVSINFYKNMRRHARMDEDTIILNDYIFEICDDNKNYIRTELRNCNLEVLKNFLSNIEFES